MYIYRYTRVYTPFGGYTFNLGDYEFRNEVRQWKKWNEKNWITPAGNRQESISPRESRDEVAVALGFQRSSRRQCKRNDNTLLRRIPARRYAQPVRIVGSLITPYDPR